MITTLMASPPSKMPRVAPVSSFLFLKFRGKWGLCTGKVESKVVDILFKVIDSSKKPIQKILFELTSNGRFPVKCVTTGELCRTYNEYISSDHWQNIRSDFFASGLFHGSCEHCHEKVNF